MSARGPEVSDVMTRAPIVIEPDCALGLAAEIMTENSIRHLPIVDNGLLVGLVSQRDLLAAGQEDAVVRDVMSEPCAVVGQDAPAFEAARQLLTLKIGCLPVVDGGALVGIVTETDFVRVAYALLAATTASAERATQHKPKANGGAKRAHKKGDGGKRAKSNGVARTAAKRSSRTHAPRR